MSGQQSRAVVTSTISQPPAVGCPDRISTISCTTPESNTPVIESTAVIWTETSGRCTLWLLGTVVSGNGTVGDTRITITAQAIADATTN